MAKIDLTDSERYERILRGPTLPVYSITKSSQNIPGEIFTSEFDYQTTFYATYHIDSHPQPHHPLPTSSQSPPSPLRPRSLKASPNLHPAPIPEPSPDHSLHLPKDSYQRFVNLLPLKKNKNKAKTLKQASDTALTSATGSALPIKNKVSTNILKGSVLRPSFTRSSNSNHRNENGDDVKIRDEVADLGRHQTRPNNFHPRVAPPLVSSSSYYPEHHSPPRTTSPTGEHAHSGEHANNEDEETLPSPSLDSQQSSSTTIPPHIIHSRLMGWKLTSPERRKELIQIFKNIHSSENHEQEEFVPEEVLEERKRVFKRQTDAYESTINRISSNTKNKLKYSIKSEKKFTSTSDQLRVITTKDARRLDQSNDPFQHFLQQKNQNNLTKNLLQEGGASGKGSDEALLDNLTSKWGFSSTMMKPILPDYQNRARDPKILFEHPDRMELLESAASIEKAASKTISNNLELSKHSSHRTLRLPSMDPNAPLEQKLTKVVSEPFLREISVRSANRKKRELAEERKLMEDSAKNIKKDVEKTPLISIDLIGATSSQGMEKEVAENGQKEEVELGREL